MQLARHRPAPRTHRWIDQRWLVDNIIRSVGLDWDQPRTALLTAACGPDFAADIAAIARRVQKFADIGSAFEAAAAWREGVAAAAYAADRLITARESYYAAAQFWASAQWPLDSVDEHHLELNRRKRACYSAYARLSDHPVEEVWIDSPVGRLPAWLHLPPGCAGQRVPAVVFIPGLDGYKERSIALYGDKWLARGIAVLAIEGPGQCESAVLGLYANVPAWQKTGTAAFEFLSHRPDIDPERIGLFGSSLGSLLATICLGAEPRFRACAVRATVFEPGCRTVFVEGCPSFKQRFMYTCGHHDEAAFDEFSMEWNWEAHVGSIRAPFLALCGEADELSPVAETDRMMNALDAPKCLVVYQDSRHALGGVSSTQLGPSPANLVVDWMMDRFAGRAFESARWYVDARGTVTLSAY